MFSPKPPFPQSSQSAQSTPSLDFALLQRPSGQALRSWRMLWWLLGLMLLVVASVVALVLYLHAFEQEEEERRRVSDGQWLEQSVRFHFLRLEEDLRAQARQALQQSGTGTPGQPVTGGAAGAAGVVSNTGTETGTGAVQGGQLWGQPGAVLWHGWQPRPGSAETTADAVGAANAGGAQIPQVLRQTRAAHPRNAEALASMFDIAIGLRRASYAGPMRAAGGQTTDTVWLAVPYFERGQLLGNYMAALSMQACVEGLVPAWFHQLHRVRLADSADLAPAPAGQPPYLAAMNLPGTDLFIEITPLQAQPAMVPRLFLLVALTFLAGMLISLAVLRRDMAKRQQVQALLQAQMVLRTAMESSITIGMRAWAQDGRVLYVNEAFCRMVGYSAAELLGQRAPMPYWPADLVQHLGAQHRDVTTHGTRSEGLEVQFEHRDGHRVDVLVHEAPLTTASGQPVGWMSSVLDISDKKRAERLAAQQQERLEASGRLVAVGEVASTLAHELNQPLGALSSFANGLLNRLHDHSIALDAVVPVVARMARLSDRAGAIIQRINAFARQRELVLAPVGLARFVHHCIVTHPRSSTAVQVRWTGTPDQAVVLADELLLEHVAHNLLANALAWSARGTTGPACVQVAVATCIQAQGPMAMLSVADNGPGVPPESRDHIFNAFFSTHEGGMGMGLAICRSIVEAHHGRIEVDSDPALGGARFTVWLPLTAETPATTTAPATAIPQPAPVPAPVPAPAPGDTP